MPDEELEEKLSEEIAQGAGIGFLGKVGIKFLGFPIKILLARVLGPAGLGIFQFGRNLLSWLVQFSKLGLNKASIRFVSMYEGEQNKEHLKGFLITALLLPLLASMIIGVTIFLNRSLVTSYFADVEILPYIGFFLMVLPLMVLDRVTDAALRGFRNVDQKMKVRLLQIVSNLILLSGVFLLGYRIIGAIGALFLSYVLSVSLSLFFVYKNYSEWTPISKPSFELNRWARFASPLYLSDFVYTTTRNLDILLLGFFMTSSDIGVYSIAFSLSALLSFPLSAINQIFPSIISDLYNKGDLDTVENLYQLSTRWIYIISFPIFLTLFIYAGEIITLIFGKEYLGGVTALRILLVSEIFNFGFGSVGFMLQMTDNQDWSFYTGFVSALTNLVLNIILIPKFGISGAAIATGVSLVVNNSLQYYVVYSKLGFILWNFDYVKLVIPLLTYLGAYSLLVGSGIHFLIQMVVCLSALSIALIYALNDADKKIIRKVVEEMKSKLVKKFE